jgi:hypothetical protein
MTKAFLTLAALVCMSANALAESSPPLGYYDAGHCLAYKPNPGEEPQCVEQPTDDEIALVTIVNTIARTGLCEISPSVMSRYRKIMQRRNPLSPSIVDGLNWDAMHGRLIHRTRVGPDPAGAVRILCDELKSLDKAMSP